MSNKMVSPQTTQCYSHGFSWTFAVRRGRKPLKVRKVGAMERAMRTPVGEMQIIAPGVIMHRITEGVSIKAADAHIVKQVTEELAGGEPAVVVVDMRGVAFADRQARDAFKEGAGGVEIGTALLTDRGFSEKLAGLFERYSEPTRPVEMFHSEADAIDWAKSLLAG